MAKARSELDELAAEAALVDQAMPDADAPAVGPADDGDDLPPIGDLVAFIASTVCRSVGVSPLADDEARQLAAKSERVASYYDIKLEGRTAAWLGLGLVGLGIAGPRVQEYRAARAAAAVTADAWGDGAEPAAQPAGEAVGPAGDGLAYAGA